MSTEYWRCIILGVLPGASLHGRVPRHRLVWLCQLAQHCLGLLLQEMDAMRWGCDLLPSWGRHGRRLLCVVESLLSESIIEHCLWWKLTSHSIDKYCIQTHVMYICDHPKLIKKRLKQVNDAEL